MENHSESWTWSAVYSHHILSQMAVCSLFARHKVPQTWNIFLHFYHHVCESPLIQPTSEEWRILEKLVIPCTFEYLQMKYLTRHFNFTKVNKTGIVANCKILTFSALLDEDNPKFCSEYFYPLWGTAILCCNKLWYLKHGKEHEVHASNELWWYFEEPIFEQRFQLADLQRKLGSEKLKEILLDEDWKLQYLPALDNFLKNLT